MSDCCSCCCCCDKTEGTPPPATQPPERCSKYQVTINRIEVTQVDDGFLGGDLEVTYTFVVNGQARTWDDPDLGVGITNIGITFFVDVPADTSTITLEVSGIEHDPVFDDTLPGFTEVWGQAQDWGLGSHQRGASDSNITYTLNYTIVCAQKTRLVISGDALIAMGHERARSRKKISEIPGAPILRASSLERLRRAGWNLVQAADGLFVLEGFGNRPMLIERKYIVKGEGKGRPVK